MLDSIYHMTSELLKSHFWSENMKILPSLTLHYNGHHSITLLICKPLVVHGFYYMVLFHSQRELDVRKKIILPYRS